MRHYFVIPGSFNPFHEGHEFIGKYCRAFFDNPTIYYEITTNNVDKGFITDKEVNSRSAPILDRGWEVIYCPHAAFIDKARFYSKKFTNCLNKKWWTEIVYEEAYFHFAVGMDTFARILDPKYAGSKDKLNLQLREMLELGVSFLVFKRGEYSFGYHRKAYWDDNNPTNLDAREFRMLFNELNIETPNISSTELRGKA